jgi:T5SS/PEP-CTERM-associated repeat protein
MSIFSRRRFNVRCGLVLGLLISGSGLLAPPVASAAVSNVGQVTPDPPDGGGNVAAPFIVGDTLFGSLTINGGTALTVTGGSAVIGNALDGIGIATLTGFGSNFITTGTADITIGNAGTGDVLVSNLAQITIGDDLFVGANPGGSGILVIDGLGSIVDANDQVQVGQFGTGVIEVTAGGRMLADDTIIGQNSEGDGRVTVAGSQSLWRQSNAMTVGDSGRATLQVFDHGRMETTNLVTGNFGPAFGEVEVAGEGAVWEITGFMTLGAFGHSTILITDGGRITNTSSARMATMAGSESLAVVSGANSLWAVGTTLTVGEFGFGTLEVLSSGRVTSADVKLGDNTNSRGEATVDGVGSTWEITGTLDVSEPAEGRLTISDGGLVTTTGVTRVNAAGELVLNGGRLSVASAGGTTNNGLIRGGGTITGPVTNSGPGEIRVDPGDRLVLGNSFTNQGLISVDGGELEILGNTSNSLDFDVRDSVLRFQGGFGNNSGSGLSIVGGNVDVFGTINNSLGAQVVVGGEAHAAFHDAFTNNGGLFITPGSELLTLENLGFGGGASLNLQIAGTDLDEFGQVHVAGSASLAGTLDVDLLGGFTPSAGDSFQIITAGIGRSGFFANENLPSLPAGLGWDVEYNPNSVVLSVVSVAVPGDYNNNGVVDAADYVLWRDGGPLANEVNNPGVVNAQDYTEWRSRLGNSGSGSGLDTTSAAVPEPGSMLLAIVAACVIVAGRSRGRVSQRRDYRLLTT